MSRHHFPFSILRVIDEITELYPYPSTIYFTFIWTLSAIDPCHYNQCTRVESVPLEVVESCSPWELLLGPFTGSNLLRIVANE